MKSSLFITAFCIGVGVVASGQALAQTTTTQTTKTETKYATVDGEVVRYEAGHVIVIRGRTTRRSPTRSRPASRCRRRSQVGRRVTLFTEPGTDGTTQLVSRVTTTSVMPDGDVKRTTEDTRHLPSGATTLTTTTSISGKVEAYEAGKTLTLTRADGSKVTYVINAKSKVPADLVIGKTVTILPMVTSGPGEPVAQTITYVTTTKTETVPER